MSTSTYIIKMLLSTRTIFNRERTSIIIIKHSINLTIDTDIEGQAYMKCYVGKEFCKSNVLLIVILFATYDAHKASFSNFPRGKLIQIFLFELIYN